jgi:hypothetical protein
LPLKEVGRRFAGKVCFLTSVDVQSTLPCGSYQDINREAKDLIEYWGTPKGGLMIFSYSDARAIDVTQERNYFMCQAFRENMKFLKK